MVACPTWDEDEVPRFKTHLVAVANECVPAFEDVERLVALAVYVWRWAAEGRCAASAMAPIGSSVASTSALFRLGQLEVRHGDRRLLSGERELDPEVTVDDVAGCPVDEDLRHPADLGQRAPVKRVLLLGLACVLQLRGFCRSSAGGDIGVAGDPVARHPAGVRGSSHLQQVRKRTSSLSRPPLRGLERRDATAVIVPLGLRDPCADPAGLCLSWLPAAGSPPRVDQPAVVGPSESPVDDERPILNSRSSV